MSRIGSNPQTFTKSPLIHPEDSIPNSLQSWPESLWRNVWTMLSHLLYKLLIVWSSDFKIRKWGEKFIIFCCSQICYHVWLTLLPQAFLDYYLLYQPSQWYTRIAMSQLSWALKFHTTTPFVSQKMNQEARDVLGVRYQFFRQPKGCWYKGCQGTISIQGFQKGLMLKSACKNGAKRLLDSL